MDSIYLDNAATTKIDPEILRQVSSHLATGIYNPSSSHQFGRKTKTLLEQSRRKIATQLGVLPKEIIFTSGATEANNLILHSAIFGLNVTKVITTRIEHPAVLDTLLHYEKQGHISIDFLPLNECGDFSLAELAQKLEISTDKTLVSLMHGNNELGNLLDIDKVASLCEPLSHVYFHSDTVQTIGHLDFKIPTGLDFATASAHKIHGLHGIGMGIFKQPVKSQLLGGPQERGHRAGTENSEGILSLSMAIEKTAENNVSELKQYFLQTIQKHFPSVSFNGNSGELDKSLHHIINVRFDTKMSSEDLLFQLDMKGIAASIGSACSSGHESQSRVLSEILPSKQLSKPSIRFSISKYNTQSEIDISMERLSSILG